MAKREAAARRGDFTNDDSEEEDDAAAAKADDADAEDAMKLHPWDVLLQRVTCVCKPAEAGGCRWAGGCR